MWVWIETKVYIKSGKLPVHWSSKHPTKYKYNAIVNELHRSERVINYFNFEVKCITREFLSADFHKIFIRNTVEYLNKPKLIILWLPFSESNEKFTKNLIKKLVIFTINKCKLNIVWNTRNIRSPFQIKVMLNITAALFT